MSNTLLTMREGKRIKNGMLITFEGPECSGKSTQVKLLTKVLQVQGYRVLEAREPGGTFIGEEVRRLVKHVVDEQACCDEAELLLFCASRAQLTRKVLLPFLADGGIVICDRFIDSTTAYQGYARGFDISLVQELNHVATAGRLPDLTLLLDLTIDESLRRGQMRLETLFVQDRIEEESRRFHETVRQGYLKIAEDEPTRVHILDARQTRDELHNKIIEKVQDAVTRLC